MTLFLVFEGSGSDDIFLAAFTAQELAESFAKAHGTKAFVMEYAADSGYLL